MSTGTMITRAPFPLHVLLVGNKEEDFYLIREILGRSELSPASDLDHAHSVEEAKTMLEAKAYNLVLFEYETGDTAGVKLLGQFLQTGATLPFILLTEHADEQTVAEIIDIGSWNWVPKAQLDAPNLARTIRHTLEMHSLQQEQAHAEISLRKLWRAVEQSDDAVMITDRNGTIEYVNPAFEAVTGYSQKDAFGQNPRFLKSGEQGPEIYQEMWTTIIAGNVFRGILINRKKNGELYYVEESICPVRDAAGVITHFISNGRDLTDRMRLEAQLSQAQKMDAVGRLAGGVAHDFNNLLTIITSYSELALDAVTPGSPLALKMQEILQAARRAAELTRQLLAFSRKQPQALRVVELNQAVERITKTLQRLIGEDIKLRFSAGSGLGPVRVDPVQIEQILMNLAANARDAMLEGGHLTIETADLILDDHYISGKPAAIPQGRYAMISVTDDGQGISPEHLPHIFEPFYTTKREGQGTGLGLATVYGIVKQNKGYIWAYSELSVGTVFKIYLPCVNDRGRVDGIVETRTEPAARGSETVLLVEDEHAVRRAAAEFMQLQGYTVLEAKDGLDALCIARDYSSPIDLVVTDVVMPNLSGGVLAKELERLRPNTRLLFVSGYAGKTVLDHKVVDLDANFLQKPYTLKQLSGKMREALSQREAPLMHASS